jgi:3-mercaptopyruvate sulfurtransferase SseA
MKRNLVKSLSPWISFWVITAALLLLMGCAHTPTSKPTSEIKVPRITKEEVKSMIGNPDLIILDVRSAQNWSESEWKIKGAVREDRKRETSAWMGKYPKDKILVLYCA